MKRRKQSILRAGSVQFVACHSVLADFARDLARALGAAPEVRRPVVIHVGAHLSSRLPGHEDALQIGLQTEQILDATGKEMWFSFDSRRIEGLVSEFDLVLDLSIHNAPAYRSLPVSDRARVKFGPHIFPDHPLPTLEPGQRLLFAGAVNSRRRSALDDLGSRARVLEDGTFGEAADLALIAAEGMLNLHFVDGVYTEYPRLLKTVLAGRALWSEPLAEPFVEGLHYFAPTARPERAVHDRVQQAMAGMLSERYSLRRFLAALDRDGLAN